MEIVEGELCCARSIAVHRGRSGACFGAQCGEGTLTSFQSIELHNWRQFSKVKLALDQQTTIITGANGSGKTTLLNTLSMHFGWALSIVATPRRRKRMQALWSDVYGEANFDDDEEPDNERVRVGTIAYNNGLECPIWTERYVSANYQLSYGNIQPVPGIYIPSHRPMAVYNPVASIPTNPVEAHDHYQQYQQFMLQLFGGGRANNPGKIQKESLISFAVFGEGNSSVAPNETYLRVFEDFQKKLKAIMPRDIGFRRIEIRNGDVIMITRSGDFALDAMSGGINAIFSIAWQISMFGVRHPNFTVVIDEPENHLHPKMQREFLPALANAYRDTRFIVSTHSPFIVTSFPQAAVYELSFNKRRKVEAQLLEAADLSGTPNDVLREILGVGSNLPVWVEHRVQRVLAEAADLPPEEKGRRVMDDLASLNITGAISEYRRNR